MNKVLVIVDMQNDFINGTLANEAAQKIVPRIVHKIKHGDYSKIILTRDTHFDNYLDTLEGENLPIKHCITGTEGWCVNKDIREACIGRSYEYLDKRTFGIVDDCKWDYVFPDNIEQITLVGTCTSICVVSNALILRALYPNVKIVVDASCCADVSIEKHRAALKVMKSCQIEVIGE